MWKRRLLFFLPLLLFVGIAMFMARNLGHPQQAVIRSQMIGKPVPAFNLPSLADGAPGLARSDLAAGNGPAIVNIFASWCLPCAVEAPHLQTLATAAGGKGVPLYGIAVQDAPEDTNAFLGRYGNPYARVATDTGGQMMVALGASGVPETYIVDGKGIIRHQHLGDIKDSDVPRLLAQLEAAR